MGLFLDPAERFAGELRAAEDRLRAVGLGGRRAFQALARHLAARLEMPRELWPDGPDAPASARLDAITLSADLDLFGLAYERFFSDLFKGKRGQYFTPRPLVELVADLAGVRPGERVLDPTCGSGGFLVAAHSRGAEVDGIEVDPDLAVLARLNLALHGGDPRAVLTGDVFAAPDDPDERWDVILANPPFSVRIDDPSTLARHGLGPAPVASDVVFLRAALRRLRPAGRLATLLPWSVLTNPALAWLRDELDATCVRDAVVSLPEGIFAPFGGTLTRACILVLRKRPAMLSRTLCASVTHPGYDPTRRRYKKTDPDELVALRLYLRGAPYAKAVRLENAPWLPQEALAEVGAESGSRGPTFRVAERASVVVGSARPRGEVTALSLADVDPATGEVVGGARTDDEAASWVGVVEGELLFGRMRPELRKITRAERPDDALPAALVASPEFLRLRADFEPDFLLLALRSRFAIDALPVTSGQTRPRARTDDIVSLALPDLPSEDRARLDGLLGRVRRERRRLRQVMLDADGLYAQWGAGELSPEELHSRLGSLEARAAGLRILG